MKLKDWRNEIDLIDDEIIRLINQRTRIVKKIGTLKAKAGLPVNDPNRERQIIEKIYAEKTSGSDPKSVCGIYRKILHESREIQDKVVKEVKNKSAGVYS